MTKVTAAAVRKHFADNATKREALSEAAQATVAEGARGRIHPEAIKAFNAKRSKNRRYVPGAESAARKAKAETFAANRKALAEAGFEVGKRGRLSSEAKAFLAQPK